jgi:hypothetical protein
MTRISTELLELLQRLQVELGLDTMSVFEKSAVIQLSKKHFSLICSNAWTDTNDLLNVVQLVNTQSVIQHQCVSFRDVTVDKEYDNALAKARNVLTADTLKILGLK